MKSTLKRTTVATALGIQILSIGMVMLYGIGSTPFAILSVLTIIVLLDDLRRPSESNCSIEELVEVRVSERTNILVAQVTEYEQQANTDAMTGLLNRRGGEATVSNQVSRSKNHPSPLSFLLLDIDHFKAINDQHGHAIGDVVIVEVAKCLRKSLRTSDIAVRWGGEEYLVVLPDTNIRGAVNAAEKLREQVALLEIHNLRVSVSIGCAELGQDDFTVALARSDMNLYFAKSKGRNRVFPDFDQNVLDR